MPTQIEGHYLDRGDRLPEGLTWEMVAQRRARWNVPGNLVPIAISPGCLGWGVPFIRGVPLDHPGHARFACPGADSGIAAASAGTVVS